MPERLDDALVGRGLLPNRERAVQEIRAGNVIVDDRVVDKPGTRVAEGARLRLRVAPAPYVSRGGRKLEAALDGFGVAPAGRTCADFGASTGYVWISMAPFTVSNTRIGPAPANGRAGAAPRAAPRTRASRA